ncbi:MAG TPA: cytochrome c-type biogenesis protein CcmH [Gemmatimonadales bacterium]|nr:cytochrome c-type biogenesis protein CcmH [Gemmatimonadales bacterium]
MNTPLARREFFAVVAGAIGAMVQDTTHTNPGAPVYDPERAGRPREPTTAADNDAHLQAIEKKLRCSCGCGLDIYTCRTTDFTCTYSPALHKRVVQLAEQGKSAQQIIDDFVAQYGEAALMAPPRRGFNLAGYFVPSIVIVIAGVLLALTLRRWAREALATAPAAPVTPDASPDELERLRRELDRLPG